MIFPLNQIIQTEISGRRIIETDSSNLTGEIVYKKQRNIEEKTISTFNSCFIFEQKKFTNIIIFFRGFSKLNENQKVLEIFFCNFEYP